MKRIVVIAASCLSVMKAAHPHPEPSERLMHAALGDHFTRYFCVSKFPEMTREIQRSYDSSRLRFVAAPCRGIKCSSPEHSEGMQVLLEKSRLLSESEAKEACASYGEKLREIEEQYAGELNALFQKSDKLK